MKRFILCFLMAMFCGANVFGAVSDVSRAVSGKTSEKSESIIDANRAGRRVNNTANKNATDSRTIASRNVSRTNSDTKDVTSRSVSRNTQKNITSRTNADTTVVSRNTRNENTITRQPVARTASSDVVSRNKNVRPTRTVREDENRNIQERAVLTWGKKQNTPTAESIATAKDMLEKTADLNNTCQQQYNECMDQFCAVIDANQKRCSCSENLSRYAKVQQAVEDANAELNDVAQNIRYLGLSADEIRAIMNETEAELELSKSKDTSKTRSMLEDIADMIKDPSSKTSASSWLTNTDSIFDMDFDFSSESSDLFGLDLFSSNTNDISSKRGKDLYREAVKRCKPVLNQCKDAGATESQISGNYDLEISKDCIAYEQGLEKLNQTLLSNVRSANLMLQKGRLAVLQNKNQYDIRECIGALENCMLDEMVCGEDYIKCLDPTKNYIDENGNVVLGRNITNITGFMEDPNGDATAGYSNTKITADFVQNSIGDTTCANSDGACIVNYLMSKIGTGQSAKDGGLCRAVLDKCQDYTYESNGKTSTYKPYNDVVVNYIQRALVNIHAAQSRVISDYASTCMSDISDCYNQQVSQINSFSATATANSIYNIMTGACYNVALTCGYAVFAYDVEVGNAVSAAETEAEKRAVLIRAISELFYQSLLCPSNSTFDSDGEVHDVDENRTISSDTSGYVNARCKCNAGYSVWGGTCVATCSDNQYRNALGACVSCDTGTPSGGISNTKENSFCATSGNNCPLNSAQVEPEVSRPDSNLTINGYVTVGCRCLSNFTVWNNECQPKCYDSQYRDTDGICKDCEGTLVYPQNMDEGTVEANACNPVAGGGGVAGRE